MVEGLRVSVVVPVCISSLVLCPLWFMGLDPTSPRTKAATVPSGPSSALRRPEIQSEEEEEAVEEGQPS